ncbi:General substrate transporter [Alicyclobacillus hesperidum URH17-3-68]|uniref:MFS transporter n=1 Tax=Alicyclobacillus hesperidum TaxID=89784 RepID=UPI000281BBA1|nr:MFS transporter [Alicyclobacillus hesperidum]EJY55761.1 General substrate transporter [Alicyclobacillus hesperidum URH17-3-68]KRW92448.1 arabinose ABC transporter permease [Alicyclobacillus tengchongensis]GLG01147.1 MFS transporter [Alicyclobacillus hesperidum subsp. aegles]
MENALGLEPRAAAAISRLVEKYSPSGTKIGWLMIASIFIEAWDLYSISFVIVFIKAIYHPSALMLGLASAATQGGALIGALIGGWLTDKIGRRAVFLGTMLMFFVFGVLQAFATDMTMLVIIRFIIGIPLGTDIANGYTYIMEFMQSGKREVMGNRWQIMFAVGEVVAIAVVLLFLGIGVKDALLWRIVLGLSGVPAIILFFLRLNLPETAIWLIQRGRYREAKAIARQMYGDPLEMLPDADEPVPTPKLREFLRDLRKDPVRFRASLYGWIAGFMQNGEFATFAFYLPVLFALVHVTGTFDTDLITLAVYVVALISGLVGPLITPKIGQKKLSIWGFSIVGIALLIAAAALYTGHNILLPFAAGLMLWGHYWDAENCMTIPSMVASARYRGISSGFAYMWIKVSGFLGIFLFPSFFAMIGTANATLFTVLFPLCGLLASVFILPEVYGYVSKEG